MDMGYVGSPGPNSNLPKTLILKRRRIALYKYQAANWLFCYE